MISRLLSAWSWFGCSRPGLFSGTLSLLLLMLLVHAVGIQASLSLGPEGNFPRLKDVFLYALSHDDAPSLLVNLCCLLLLGPCQERRWGTVAFLALSVVSMAALPCAYSLVLWVGAGEASRVCGYSGVQLALFTAQCRQVRGRKLLRCVPPWLLPWLTLLLALLLLPATPALLHFCAICIGHNYGPSFIETIQELEEFGCVELLPDWAFISTSSRLRLPTHSTPHRHSHHSEALHTPHSPEEPGPSLSTHHPGTGPHLEAGPFWLMSHPHTGLGPRWGPEPSQPGAELEFHRFSAASEAELLEEQLLHAGIVASLQNTPDCSHPRGEVLESPDVTLGGLSSLQDVMHHSDLKVELPKSSVSSLRLQQLERMGFPTEKAVVALAASKQLEGAVSLLIDDSIGSEAVVVGAKSQGSPPLS